MLTKKSILKPYSCKICANEYFTQSDLNQHEKIEHGIDIVTAFKCTACLRSFKTRRSLSLHIIHKKHNLNKNIAIPKELSAQMKNATEEIVSIITPPATATATATETENNSITPVPIPNVISKNGIDLRICRYCNCGFALKSQLENHLNLKHNDVNMQLFNCKYCYKTFNKKRNCIRHEKSVHNKSIHIYFCGHCLTNNNNKKDDQKEDHHRYGYISQQLLFEHINRLHNNNNDIEWLEEWLEDWPNDVLLNNDIDFQLDMDNVQMVEEFLDDTFLEEALFMDVENFNEQMIMNPMTYDDNNGNELPFKCNVCLQGFSGIDEKIQHEILSGHNSKDELSILDNNQPVDEQHHPSNNDLDRIIDGMIYVERINDKKHIIPLVNNFKCPVAHECSEKFTRQIDLKIHLAHVHNRNVLRCNDCDDVSFNKLDEYVKHHRIHHIENRTVIKPDTILEPRENTIKLQQNKQFNQRTPSAHLNLNCNLCDKRFTSTGSLKYHLKSHNGLKPFKCPYCQKTFIANTNLTIHILNLHSAYKRYKCHECSGYFSTSDHLTKHINFQHRSIRKFQCDQCDQKFFQKSHLNDHQWIHNGIKPHQCEFCSSAFARKQTLKNHLLKTHKIQYTIC